MLIVVLATLWRYPSTELVIFHCVWIGLAVVALRSPSPRAHSWALVGVVTGLAFVIEMSDVRNGSEGLESIVEIGLDLVAFVALVYLASRHREALAAEHAAAVAEHAAAVAEHRRNDRQRAFFANASHALRTPITVAQGHAELAMQDTISPSARSDLAVVLEELERLTAASYRILQLSVAGKFDGQVRQPVDVDELVRTTIDRWRPAALRRWTADAKCGGVIIVADREALTEALDALVDNALAATSTGSSITVSSQIDGEMIVLSVSDDGPGIEDFDPDDLFDAFERGPRTAWQRSGGTGLGLSIVRAIAREHGGDATMVSSAGSGTTVRLTIPSTPAAVSDVRSTTAQPPVDAL